MKRSGAEDHPLGAYDQDNDYLDNIALRNTVLESNTIVVLLSETVFLKVVPKWNYVQKQCFWK